LFLGVLLFLLFSGLARYWAPYALGRRWNRASAPSRGPRNRHASLRFAAAMVAVAAVGWATRAALVEPYRVLSPSMLPTLEPDDLVAGCKRPCAPSPGGMPARGEIVVFRGASLGRSPGGVAWPDVLVKRVIGLPGDRISVQDGLPIINGWSVPSCDAGEYMYMLPDPHARGVHGRLRVEFLDDGAYLTVRTMGAAFDGTYEVKPREVFVLGDNRGNSMDSRSYGGGRGGGVPVDAIDAHIRRFLLGTHRSGRPDVGRFLDPVDTLQTRVRLEGLRTDALEGGIARCLATRPADTHPPSAAPVLSSAVAAPLDFGGSILEIERGRDDIGIRLDLGLAPNAEGSSDLRIPDALPPLWSVP
jgi:signal peptidase I